MDLGLRLPLIWNDSKFSLLLQLSQGAVPDSIGSDVKLHGIC
jgi:hypothetical protein